MTIDDLERVKKAVIRRYPISAGLALEGVKLELSKKVSTAAVIAKKNDKGINEVEKIIVNPEFFESLSFKERVFVLAHEALHIALKHLARSVNKPEADAERKYREYCEREPDENKRKMKKAYLHSHYQKIWNIATDACINAFLKQDGFTYPENVIDPNTGKKMQFVDLKDGFTKSAEKIYDDLVKQEEEKEKQKTSDEQHKVQEQKNENNSQQQDSRGSTPNENGEESPYDDFPDPDSYDGFDSHEEWNDDVEDTKEINQEQDKTSDVSDEDILKKELEERKKKESKPKDLKKSISTFREKSRLPDFVPFKSVVSWKRLLVGTIERTVEVWGKRRASRFNPNARLEERVVESGLSVEIILDVSGSISVELLRGFLLQLYPIFETLLGNDNVTMKVGTFSDEFHGFEVISSKKDIAEYNPKMGGWTNYEAAVTAFSKGYGEKPMKIIFTDGFLDGKPSHVQVTRAPDILWIVFGDKMNFTPLGGRIIRISEKEYQEMLTSKMVNINDDTYSI